MTDIDFAPVCNLCDVCILSEDCPLAAAFPALGCPDWDDGYRGSTYFDADAWLEWKRATYDESTRPPQR